MNKWLLSGITALSLSLTHAEMSWNDESFRLGYTITKSTANQLLADLIWAGVFDNSGSAVPGLSQYRATFSNANLNLLPAENAISLDVQMKVHIRTLQYWTYTETYSFTIPMQPQVITDPDGGKQYKICPQTIPTGGYFPIFTNNVPTSVNSAVRDALNAKLSDTGSCIVLTAMSSIYPKLPQNMIAEPMAVRIETDRITFSAEIKRSAAYNKAATTDYDGDGISDLSVKTDAGYGRFVIDYASNGFGAPDVWLETSYIGGGELDVAVPADYDGDGKTDFAVRSEGGAWLINYARDGFGNGGEEWQYVFDGGNNWDPACTPVPADYDGDGLADISVMCWDGTGWKIDYSRDGLGNGAVLVLSLDIPPGSAQAVPADYDGDGRADVALKTNEGYWIDWSGNGFGGWDVFSGGWGDDAYKAAPADFDGDGKADMAVVFNDSYMNWYVDYSADGIGGGYAEAACWIPFGSLPIVPAPSDFDGDGIADIAGKDLLDEGVWAIDYSSNGFGSMDAWVPGWDGNNAHPLHKSLNLQKEGGLTQAGNQISLSFSLPKASSVRISAYELNGKLTAELFAGSLMKGSNKVDWSKSDLSSRGLRRGSYFLTIRAEGFQMTKKLMLVD